jgi:aryl-alcohol dehydrogenase-like predicted oxidoreductase
LTLSVHWRFRQLSASNNLTFQVCAYGVPTAPRTESVVRETVAVAAEIGASPPQVALAWLFTR